MRIRRSVSLAVLAVMLALSAGNVAAQQSASMNETITFFYYEDLEAQVPFYEGLLGLEKTMDEDWVKIYRITATSSVGLVLQGRGVHQVSDDKPAMLSIVTDDVDAWYEKLAGANVSVTSELPALGSDKEPGSAPVRGFIVEDPGGYTIEFFSWQKTDTSALEQQVEGLWFYTGLTSSSGNEMPLTGVFLIKDGVFVQHAVFNGEPIEDQGAMAHAGPYLAAAESIHLVAEQTISTAPLENSPLTSRGLTEHDVTVSRSGDNLTLVFSMGTGTVQNFERVGPGDGEVYSLPNGALAFIDGYFVLVEGNESGVVAGYGTFEKAGESMTLNVIRWTESDQSTASNLGGTSMQATFDGQSFTLEDGRSFLLTPPD